MQRNRLIMPLGFVALVAVNACAIRYAHDQYWPEFGAVWLMAMLQAQVALALSWALLGPARWLPLRVSAGMCAVAALSVTLGRYNDTTPQWQAIVLSEGMGLGAVLLFCRGAGLRWRQSCRPLSTPAHDFGYRYDSGNLQFTAGQLLTCTAATAAGFTAVRLAMDWEWEAGLATVALGGTVIASGTILAAGLRIGAPARLVAFVIMPVAVAECVARVSSSAREPFLLWAGLEVSVVMAAVAVVRVAGYSVERLGAPAASINPQPRPTQDLVAEAPGLSPR